VPQLLLVVWVCSAQEPGCLFEENVDYAASADIEAASSGFPSHLHCADWCAVTERCEYWVHVGFGHDGMCFLKTAREPVMPRAANPDEGLQVTAGNKACGDPSSMVAKGCILEENADHATDSDTVLRAAITGFPEYLSCADWCAGTEGCEYWVHLGTGEDGSCWLKTARDPAVQPAPDEDGRKFTAGNKACGDPENMLKIDGQGMQEGGAQERMIARDDSSDSDDSAGCFSPKTASNAPVVDRRQWVNSSAAGVRS